MPESHVRRMRVFAGPNSSGKSTFVKDIQHQFYTGVYINADDIEKAGREKGFINLGDYGLHCATETFADYLQSATLAQKAYKDGFPVNLKFSDNVIRISKDTIPMKQR